MKSSMFIIGAALVFSGCSIRVPEALAPSPVALPDDWQAQPVAQAEPPATSWIADFDDAALAALVDEALRASPDLRASAARIAVARARFGITNAARGPQVQADFAGRRNRRSGANDVSFIDNPANLFSIRGQLNWELDLWQRLAADSEAALADVEAARWDLQAARLSLAANIAREWFNAAAAQRQVALGEATVASFERSLATVEAQYRRGLGAALDVRLARNNLEGARADLAQSRRDLVASLRLLEVLAGRYPAAAVATPIQLRKPERAVPAGVPSQLLARRPDLRAAERRLRASQAREVAARRNWLPQFSLTADGGTSSTLLRELTNLEQHFWTLAGSAVQPLFQSGRLRAQREEADANLEEARATYAGAVLTALREVEQALDAEGFLADQEAALARAAAEAAQAQTLALRQYERGLADIITLLEAQRRAFAAENALISVKNQRLQNRVNLYAALGGPAVPDAGIGALAAGTPE